MGFLELFHKWLVSNGVSGKGFERWRYGVHIILFRGRARARYLNRRGGIFSARKHPRRGQRAEDFPSRHGLAGTGEGDGRRRRAGRIEREGGLRTAESPANRRENGMVYSLDPGRPFV